MTADDQLALDVTTPNQGQRQHLQSPTGSGMGVVRLGNGPKEPSPTPLGWQTMQFQMVGADNVLQWQQPEATPLHDVGPAEARQSLWERRKDRNRVRIPDGMEFDQYHPDCVPDPAFNGARVRVRFFAERPDLDSWVAGAPAQEPGRAAS